MRKFTKLMLTLALLVAGVGGVNATKVYGDLSRYGDKYDAGTGVLTMTWTGQWGNQIRPSGNPILPTGDLSEYTLYVTTTEIYGAPDYRILVYTEHGQGTITVKETGTKSFKLSEVENCDISNVTEIVLSGSSSGMNENVDAAYAKISKLYIEKPTNLVFDDNGKAVIDKTDISATGGLSINEETGVITTNGQEGEVTVTFQNPVDLSAMKSFNVTRSGDESILSWMNFEKEVEEGGSKNVHTGSGWWTSRFYPSFNAEQAARAKDVKKLIWHSNGITKNEGETDEAYASRVAALSLTISKIEITSAVFKATLGGEKPVESLPRMYYDDGTWKTGTVSYSYGSSIGTPVGDGNATQDEYIELSDYDEIRLYVSSGDVRIFIVKEDGFKPTADGYILTKDGVKQNGQWGGVQDANHKLVKNGDYYFITIADIKAACGGQAKLIGVKAEYGQTVDISKVVVISDGNIDYNISGSGVMTVSVSNALADVNATSYDATGVTGTGVELTPANPNALFIANDGALSNTQNVIVGSTCAKLSLQDNYPFKAPADFTATEATYTTDINSAAQAGTLCLPFVATIPANVKAYTLTYATGDAATATEVTTIPANTPVLLNGSGEATFTGSGSIVANAANVREALTGVFEKTFVPAGSYVLQNGNEGIGFYKVAAANTIEAKPFRAYLTAASAARSLKINFAGEATGIENVAAEAQQAAQYFDLQGRRVAQPTKGLYIVNGKKMMVK